MGNSQLVCLQPHQLSVSVSLKEWMIVLVYWCHTEGPWDTPTHPSRIFIDVIS